MTTPRTYSRTSPGKYSLWLDFETSGADFDSGETFKKYQGISFGAVIADNETLEEVDASTIKGIKVNFKPNVRFKNKLKAAYYEYRNPMPKGLVLPAEEVVAP